MFKPKDYEYSVFHGTEGPNFGAYDLGMVDDPMNGNNSGYCWIDNNDNNTYKDIGCDSEGNHVLTGDGKD